MIAATRIPAGAPDTRRDQGRDPVELMGQRAAADPDKAYFTLFDTPVPYGQLWRESERYAAGLRRFGIERGDKVCLIYPTCAEFFYTFFGALRLGRRARAALPHARRGGHRQYLPRLRGQGRGHHRLVPHGRGGVRGRGGEYPARPGAEPTSRPTPAAALPRPRRGRRRLHPVHLGQHRAAARRGAEPRQRVPHGGVHGGGRPAHPRGRRGVVAAALPRHGADRLRLHPAHHGGAAPSPAARPQEPARLARARHPRAAPPSRSRRTSATGTASATSRDTTGLELSSLKQALSGAEPVRLSTIEAFERKFDIQNVITPCYGLAEATLAVAIWPRCTPLRLDTLRQVPVGGPPVPGRVGPHHAGGPGGRAGRRGRDRASRAPGVMQGYYNNPEATRQRALARRLAPHGRPRLPRRRGLSLRHRPASRTSSSWAARTWSPPTWRRSSTTCRGVRYSAAVGIDSERTGTQRLHVVAEVRERRRRPRDPRRARPRDRPARAPRRAATGPPRCSSSGPAPSPRPRAARSSAPGWRDDRRRRAAATRSSTRRRAPRLARCPPLADLRLPPAGVRPHRHARQRARLRAAHGGAGLRVAVGERPRGAPLHDPRRSYPYNPTGQFPLPPDGRLPRAADHPGAGGRRDRARAARHHRPRAARTAIPCSPRRCWPRSTTWPSGRVILGVGVGWMREEIELLGGNFDRRGAWSDEAIRDHARLLADERARYHGRVLLLRRDRRAAPRPPRKPSPSGSAATRRGRSAAWPSWATAGTPRSRRRTAFERDIARLREECAQAQPARSTDLAITSARGCPSATRPAAPTASRCRARRTRSSPTSGATATLGVGSVLLEARYRDLDDMVGIFETFAREIRPRVGRAAPGRGGCPRRGRSETPPRLTPRRGR